MSTFGTFRELSAQFEVGQGSEVLYGQFEVGQDSAELLCEADIQQLGSIDLLGKFEAQAIADLLGNIEIQQSGSAELLGKFEAQDVADLLGKFEAQGVADFLGKFDVGQDSLELLGKFESQAIAELLGDAIIKNSNYAELLSKADIGQDSADLLGKFEAQGIADLLGKFEAQGIADLLGKAIVAQGSAEFLGEGVVMGADSSDLKCIADIEHSADLLGKAIFGHPALPTWLKAVFLTGLTNAYRDLSSILALRRAASAESLSKTVIRQIDSKELYGNIVIQHERAPANLFSKGNIKNEGPAELLCNFAVQNIGNLRARLIVGPAKNSDAYFSFWDPSDWINEVVGIGQGFIAIPWVEADSVVKTSGSSSARLTSVSGPGQYKEIRFGWGGMNWGVEAAVSPEVAPTPIDTDGRGPRRGSRASRDERREVPQSSYKELKSIFTVNELAGVVAQLRDITDADGWWQHAYDGGSAFLLVPNSDGTLTVRSHFAAGAPAVGGGAYGTNKAFLPTAGNPVTIEWEIQCNAPVGPGSSTFSTHFLGGLTDGRNTSSGSNEISLYYDGDNDQHVLEIYEEGVNSFNADWTAVSITDKIKFKIVWEHPDDVAPNGRIRVYIDDVLTFTETTVVPETELCFFFGIMLVRTSGTPTAEATLHSISEL